jgi:hypothetical protein
MGSRRSFTIKKRSATIKKSGRYLITLVTTSSDFPRSRSAVVARLAHCGPASAWLASLRRCSADRYSSNGWSSPEGDWFVASSPISIVMRLAVKIASDILGSETPGEGLDRRVLGIFNLGIWRNLSESPAPGQSVYGPRKGSRKRDPKKRGPHRSRRSLFARASRGIARLLAKAA